MKAISLIAGKQRQAVFLLVFHPCFLVEGKELLVIIFKGLMGEHVTERTGQGVGAGAREGGFPHVSWPVHPGWAPHTGGDCGFYYYSGVVKPTD